jgi:hypothetical protein
MARINEAFKWAYFAVVVSAVGARAVPGTRGETIELLCVCAIMLGFLAWAFVGYVYAWVLAVRDIRGGCASLVPVTSRCM